MNHDGINDFYNGKLFLLLTVPVFAALSFVAWRMGHFEPMGTRGGFLFGGLQSLLTSGPQSIVASVAVNVGAALMLHLLNKVFTFVRTYTFIAASSFLVLQGAMPVVSANYYSGSAMCMATLLLAFILFGSYQQSGNSQRSIYLIFTLLAACCTFMYSAVVLIVAFAIGFAQMRAMNLRGFLALLMGLATPFWILLGLGVVDVGSFRLPEFVRLQNILDIPQAPVVIFSIVGVALLTLVLTVVNLLTIFNYRLQTRVYNAFFTTLATLSVIMMVVDFNNILIYVPMLNMCLAIQVAHVFTISKFAKKHFIFSAGLVVAAVVYIANFLL